MKKEFRIHWGRGLIITIILILVISIATLIFAYKITEREEKVCWETLHISTKDLSGDIQKRIEDDRELLRTMARVIADHDMINSSKVKMHLKEFEKKSVISRIGLLLPGDIVILADGSTVDTKGELSFKREAALGEHISDREKEIGGKKENILRNYVPVLLEGKTVAMLYGVVELEQMPDLLEPDVYDGKASVYVIDGRTGDFILDTWHKSLGNVYDLGTRKMKKGYTQKQLLEEIREGKTGHVVFVSKTVGEYLYFYFEPSGINQWSVALSVPESVAFASVEQTKKMLYVLTVFECLCFVLYFFWMFFDVRREAHDKQKRLEMVSFIYDVEKILFVAHRKNEYIKTALCRICKMATAKAAFFVIYEKETKNQTFVWSERDEAELLRLLEENQCYFGFCEKYDKNRQPDGIMMIPIQDVDGNLIGALGIADWKFKWKSTELLDSVAPSFTLLYNNIRNFNLIKAMGEKDVLTGLLNRNSFEKKRRRYAEHCTHSVACIYADVNGLHELNNNRGHEAGDRMLQFVARRIKDQFGEEDTYRIGGDEFVAFSVDEEENVIQEKMKRIDTALVKAGYHASIGIAWKETPVDMEVLIKQAEKQMYEEKRQWYQNQGKDRRER